MYHRYIHEYITNTFYEFKIIQLTNIFLRCRFIQKYTELESRRELKESELYEATGKALLAEGLVLKRRGGSSVS